MLDIDSLKSILESVLFVSDKATSVNNLAQLLEVEAELIEKMLNEMQAEYEAQNRGFQLRAVAGKWSFFTNPANHQYAEHYISSIDFKRLTQAALETLAIIAYKQPVTKVYISEIRGVNSEGSVSTLLHKGLIKERGRDKSPGGPILYGTSRKFLEQMNLNSPKELPNLKDFAPDEETREQIKQSFLDEPTDMEVDESTPVDS